MVKKKISDDEFDKVLNFIGSSKGTDNLIRTFSAAILPKSNFDLMILCLSVAIGIEKIFTDVLRSVIDKFTTEHFRCLKVGDIVLNELTLSSKITIFKKICTKGNGSTKKYDGLISFARLINEQIRNNLFHNKIEHINYKGVKLFNNIAQQKLLIQDFMIFLHKHKK
jgi:hypothetical protein